MASGIVMAPAARQTQSVMVAQRRSPEEVAARVLENNNKAAELHMAKTAMSNKNFQNTRVTSSKAVLMKNGQAVCVAFPNPNVKPVDPNKNKSSETTSFSQ